MKVITITQGRPMSEKTCRDCRWCVREEKEHGPTNTRCYFNPPTGCVIPARSKTSNGPRELSVRPRVTVWDTACSKFDLKEEETNE